jgi:hypothetical protein
VTRLRSAISAYAVAISQALTVHRGVCRDIAFHEALRSRQWFAWPAVCKLISEFQKAFPEEIAIFPRPIDPSSLHAPLPPLPDFNGSDRLHAPAPTAREPTSSTRSSAYVLPPLRLGPSPSPAFAAIPSTPPPGKNSPITSNTAVSSPRASVTSGVASRMSTSTVSHQDGLIIPSLGRMLSTVGSTKGSERSRDDGMSSISEHAAADVPNGGNGIHAVKGGEGREDGLGRKETMSRKGLKRLSSLMRR